MDSPTPPLLSLCLATYNRARYLDRYLTHHIEAFEAAGIDYEIVISDNASTDDTPKILARYAEKNSRLRVIRQARNLGAYPNILTTLREAGGEVVVSIADDDLALPDQLLAYVRRLQEDPDLVMIQAPWLLMDETKDNAITGKFYDFDEEMRFETGQYGNCLAFVIQNHVFPECWVIRRSAIPAVAGPTPKFAYVFFFMLAHALSRGAVLFSPEPHIVATSVAKGANVHVGNAEAMEGWDTYRGGLELMASYARQFNPGALPDAAGVGAAINLFVCERMAVAARLQAHARNWSNTWQILRRLLAYEHQPQIGVDHDDVARLAAVETALLECAQRGAEEIVVGDAIPDHVLDRMNPITGASFVRANGLGSHSVRRAYCGIGDPDPSLQVAFSCDVVSAMDRFPIFPPAV
jgi:glycosyltransferase involved in cell wall biosynthesis